MALGWDAWVALAGTLVMLVVIVKKWMPADVAFLGTISVFALSGVITVNQAFAGFSNSGMLTVAALFIVSAGITATGALGHLLSGLYGTPKHPVTAMIRFMIPVALTSTLVNNTPVVLTFLPILQTWCAKINMPLRPLLIPLSYATILGGTVTVLGTSTNLVVTGKADEEYPDYPVGVFDISVVGLPVLFVGMAFLFAFAEPLLREKKTGGGDPAEDEDQKELQKKKTKELESGSWLSSSISSFLDPEGSTPESSSIELQQQQQQQPNTTDWELLKSSTVCAFVSAESPVVGRTVRDAGLRSLQNLYLVSLHRALDPAASLQGPETVGVDPGVELRAEDLLTFTGSREAFPGLCARLGLVPADLSEDPQDPGFESSLLLSPQQQLQRRERSERERERRSRVRRLLGGWTLTAKVPEGSGLVGRTPKELGFRDRFDAAILSIVRASGPAQLNSICSNSSPSASVGSDAGSNGSDEGSEKAPDAVPRAIPATESLRTNLGRTVLRVGDLLVLLTGPRFAQLVELGGAGDLELLGKSRPSSVHEFVEVKDSDPLLSPKEPREARYGSADRGRVSESKEGAFPGFGNHGEKIQRSRESVRKTSPREDETGHELLVSCVVTEAPRLKFTRPFDGLTVEQAGLRGLPGVFLVAIECAHPERRGLGGCGEHGEDVVRLDVGEPSRTDSGSSGSTKETQGLMAGDPSSLPGSREETPEAGKSQVHLEGGVCVIRAPAPGEVLHAGDVCWFAGSRASVASLRQIPGLEAPLAEQVGKLAVSPQQRRLVEAVVAAGSELQGRTLKEIRFRTRFGAVVIAVRRGGAHRSDSAPESLQARRRRRRREQQLLSRRREEQLRRRKRYSLNSTGPVEEDELKSPSPHYRYQQHHQQQNQQNQQQSQLKQPQVLREDFGGSSLLDPLNALDSETELSEDPQEDEESESEPSDREPLSRISRSSRGRRSLREESLGIEESNDKQGPKKLLAVGETRLRAGDVLVLEAGPEFVQRFGGDRNFLLVSEMHKSQPPMFDKFLLTAGAIVVMLAVYMALSNTLDIAGVLLPLALLTVGFMLTVRVITPAQARRAVNWEVLVTIAAAFGVSAALERSGMAEAIGEGLVEVAVTLGLGEVGIISAVYLVTVLLSGVVSNNAAALLVFGVAQTAADARGIHPHKVLFALMLGASHSFVSPFSYQCNLLVFNLGGYSVGEFARVGLLLQATMLLVSVPAIVFIDYWYLMTLGSFALFAGVLIWRLKTLD